MRKASEKKDGLPFLGTLVSLFKKTDPISFSKDVDHEGNSIILLQCPITYKDSLPKLIRENKHAIVDETFFKLAIDPQKVRVVITLFENSNCKSHARKLQALCEDKRISCNPVLSY